MNEVIICMAINFILSLSFVDLINLNFCCKFKCLNTSITFVFCNITYIRIERNDDMMRCK